MIKKGNVATVTVIQIIRELTIAREALFRNGGKSNAFDGMCNALSNLVRMWAEN